MKKKNTCHLGHCDNIGGVAVAVSCHRPTMSLGGGGGSDGSGGLVIVAMGGGGGTSDGGWW